ncbi:MAG: hypothetical protein CVV23_05790 [Ignavibacteriae bacterium HGW-Ignavibacteriae-2]|nr:MAG: hypothetical protein CVV23_05790 [Ignavibacteriae bacterium HGW-Ignavibacteriae-2]
MSNKIKQKKGSRRNLAFQLITGIVFISLIIFFVFSNFKSNDNNSMNDSEIKTRSAFEFKKQGELTFTSSDQKFLAKIDVEIAENDDTRSQGLMYRYKMNENQGMLFLFPEETYQSFWMRNTVLPLDIIFVNKQNKIVKIHKNAVPYDESSYPSGASAIYVVEVNAGYSDKFNINEGDFITWRRM